MIKTTNRRVHVASSVQAPGGNEEMTKEEWAEYRECKSRIFKNKRENIETMRQIQRKTLWRGEYDSFENFVKDVYDRTRQWATQQTNWLSVVELVEEHAPAVDRCELTSTEAIELIRLAKNIPDPGEEHYQREATFAAHQIANALTEAQAIADQNGTKRTVAMTKTAVARRLRYLENLGVHDSDLTIEESDQVDRLGGVSDRDARAFLESARENAITDGRSSSECLKQLVDNRKVDPPENEHNSEVAQRPRTQEVPLDDGDFMLPVGTATHDPHQFVVKLTGDLFDEEEEVEARFSDRQLAELLYQAATAIANGHFGNGSITINGILDVEE